MGINEYLKTLPRERVVSQFDTLLDRARVSQISWTGQRLVSVEGYDGFIELNQLLQKYLAAHPRPKDGENLRQRLAFYNLWTKVKKLCKDTDVLNNTWVYRCLVPIKECIYFPVLNQPQWRDFITSPLKGGYFPSKEQWSFSFLEKDFKKLWPDEDSEGKKLCVATKEMVERILQ